VIWRYARQIGTLVRHIREFSPDVMLVNAFDLQANTAGRLTGVPIISKVVGDTAWERAQRTRSIDIGIEAFQKMQRNPKIGLWKLLRAMPVRMADHVAVPSEFLRTIVEGWGVASGGTSVIYNAVDVEFSGQEHGERPPQVVSVGRMVRWKGLGGIIKSFEKTEFEGAELHLVGDGPERGGLEDEVERLGLSEAVTFHGRLPHERVLEIVAESRVFALNSTYEGLPHVVLEAMACGTPVVASAVCGTPEIIDDGVSGFLSDQNDIGTIARRFDQLLSDELLRTEMSRAGRERLEEQFSYDQMIDEYESLLVQTASSKPSQGQRGS
jgi:glycosyltransferase involved in cell wall biosynthesis